MGGIREAGMAPPHQASGVGTEHVLSPRDLAGGKQPSSQLSLGCGGGGVCVLHSCWVWGYVLREGGEGLQHDQLAGGGGLPRSPPGRTWGLACFACVCP